MQIHILASGSTGNSIFIELGGVRFLVDAGISARRIEQGLRAVGVAASELDAILVTHEHSDHVSGLSVLSRKFKAPVYARRRTWDAFQPKHYVEADYRRDLGSRLEIGGVRVEPFAISHDAAEPVGFSFCFGDLKCVVATDMGCVSERVEQDIAYADVMVFESNHDVAMLRNGPYPEFLKRRILGNRGHLSNLETGRCLARMGKKPGMHVFLAHLSQHNNNPELALSTVEQVLDQKGCRLDQDLFLHLAKPDNTVSFVLK
jgi:phosphoribosyl 1,2-cyclic phosphodiesterase